MSAPVDSSSERVTQCFYFYDRDGDGRLRPDEFREALQATGLAPSQKEFESLLFESGDLVSFVNFKKSVESLSAPNKILSKDAFLKKFQPLDLDTGSMSKQLLEYICTECQPKATGKNPVDVLTAEEVAYVLSLVDKVTDEDSIDVRSFADKLMDN